MAEFILELDRPRRLIYDFDAWERLAAKYSKGEEDFNFSKVNLNMSELPFLIFAGLAWEEPELTLERTKQMLNQAIRDGQIIADMLTVTTEAMFSQLGLKTAGIKEVIAAEFSEGQKKAFGPKPDIPSSKKSSRRPSRQGTIGPGNSSG